MNNKYTEFGTYLNLRRNLIYICLSKRKVWMIYFIYYLESAADRTQFGKPTYQWQNNINIPFKGMRLSALAQAILCHTCTSRYARFEYQPDYYILDWGFSRFTSVPPTKCLDNSLNFDNTCTLLIISNFLNNMNQSFSVMNSDLIDLLINKLQLNK
jgi:hypothetical protein